MAKTKFFNRIAFSFKTAWGTFLVMLLFSQYSFVAIAKFLCPVLSVIASTPYLGQIQQNTYKVFYSSLVGSFLGALVGLSHQYPLLELFLLFLTLIWVNKCNLWDRLAKVIAGLTLILGAYWPSVMKSNDQKYDPVIAFLLIAAVVNIPFMIVMLTMMFPYPFLAANEIRGKVRLIVQDLRTMLSLLTTAFGNLDNIELVPPEFNTLAQELTENLKQLKTLRNFALSEQIFFKKITLMTTVLEPFIVHVENVIRELDEMKILLRKIPNNVTHSKFVCLLQYPIDRISEHVEIALCIVLEYIESIETTVIYGFECYTKLRHCFNVFFRRSLYDHRDHRADHDMDDGHHNYDDDDGDDDFDGDFSFNYSITTKKSSKRSNRSSRYPPYVNYSALQVFREDFKSTMKSLEKNRQALFTEFHEARRLYLVGLETKFNQANDATSSEVPIRSQFSLKIPVDHQEKQQDSSVLAALEADKDEDSTTCRMISDNRYDDEDDEDDDDDDDRYEMLQTISQIRKDDDDLERTLTHLASQCGVDLTKSKNINPAREAHGSFSIEENKSDVQESIPLRQRLPTLTMKSGKLPNIGSSNLSQKGYDFSCPARFRHDFTNANDDKKLIDRRNRKGTVDSTAVEMPSTPLTSSKLQTINTTFQNVKNSSFSLFNSTHQKNSEIIRERAGTAEEQSRFDSFYRQNRKYSSENPNKSYHKIIKQVHAETDRLSLANHAPRTAFIHHISSLLERVAEFSDVFVRSEQLKEWSFFAFLRRYFKTIYDYLKDILETCWIFVRCLYAIVLNRIDPETQMHMKSVPNILKDYVLAFKISFAICLTAIIVVVFQIQFGFWAVVVIALIRQDSSSSSFLTGYQRLEGTVVGALFAFIAFEAFRCKQTGCSVFVNIPLLTFWVAVCGFFRDSPNHGYAAVVAAFTPILLLLGPTTGLVGAWNRILLTFLGIVVYLAVDNIILPQRTYDAIKKSVLLSIEHTRMMVAECEECVRELIRRDCIVGAKTEFLSTKHPKLFQPEVLKSMKNILKSMKDDQENGSAYGIITRKVEFETAGHSELTENALLANQLAESINSMTTMENKSGVFDRDNESFHSDSLNGKPSPKGEVSLQTSKDKQASAPHQISVGNTVGVSFSDSESPPPVPSPAHVGKVVFQELAPNISDQPHGQEDENGMREAVRVFKTCEQLMKRVIPSLDNAKTHLSKLMSLIESQQTVMELVVHEPELWYHEFPVKPYEELLKSFRHVQRAGFAQYHAVSELSAIMHHMICNHEDVSGHFFLYKFMIIKLLTISSQADSALQLARNALGRLYEANDDCVDVTELVLLSRSSARVRESVNDYFRKVYLNAPEKSLDSLNTFFVLAWMNLFETMFVMIEELSHLGTALHVIRDVEASYLS